MKEEKLFQSLQEVDYDGDIRGVVEQLKSILSQVSPPKSSSIPASGIVLIGGGSGTPTVGRALHHLGISDFSVFANTGEIEKKDGQLVGAGLVRVTFESIDFLDITKQSTQSRPEAERNTWHTLLDQKGDHRWKRNGYLIVEAARQLWGIQPAIDFINGLMNNGYRVAPTTEERTELKFVIDGQPLDLYEYAFRADQSRLAEELVLEPAASLGATAKQTLSQAKVACIGPGDVHFSVGFHFAVDGFTEALAEVEKIILVSNLTARKIDIPGFKLTNFLDWYDRYLPAGKEISVLVNKAEVETDEEKLEDDVAGDQYGRFRLYRAPIAGTALSANKQLIHDEQLLAKALAPLLPSS